MKIAFIGQKGIPANGGGVERYVEDLAVRLADAGHETVVYTRSHYTPKALPEYQGVKLINLPTIHTKHLDAIVHSFLATLHAMFSGVEVIHFQAIGPALVCPMPKIFRPKIKIVSTLQSLDYEHQKWGKFAKAILKLGERLMCHWSDEVIAVTKDMEQYISEQYGRSAHYIPNGANLSDNFGSDKIKKWGLEPNNYIVSIGRLVRHKGLQYLIQAYQKLNTDKKLVIVGAGAFTEDYILNLKILAGDNPNIIFTGNQNGEALAQLYANAYLFVQPSESEGLSLALLEAMARRVPVLVSDIEANCEAVGEAGFKFCNKDTTDLTEKLRFLLAENDIVKTMGEAGRARIEVKFNWANIAVDVAKVYALPNEQVKAQAKVEPAI